MERNRPSGELPYKAPVPDIEGRDISPPIEPMKVFRPALIDEASAEILRIREYIDRKKIEQGRGGGK